MASLRSVFKNRQHAVVDEVVMTEEEGVEVIVQEEDSASVWDSITRWSLYLIAFLAPLWFLPLTISPVETNKLFLVAILAIVGFIAWLGRAVYANGIQMPRTWVFLALLVWLITTLLSAFFSVSPSTSFWGSASGSFFNMLVFSLIAFLAAVSVRERDEVEKISGLVLLSGTLVTLFVILRTFFNLNILPWDFAATRTFNPLGSWNSLAIFFGFLLVTAAPLLEGAIVGRARVFLIVLTFLSLIGAALVNLPVVWIGIAALSLAFLAYGLSRSQEKRFGMPLILLLIAVLLFLSRAQISELTTSFGSPLDITPNIQLSLQIAQKAIMERPMFGYGPGMYADLWDMHKDPAINSTIYWRLRFGSGSSYATTLPATTGILGIAGFLFFVVTVLLFGFKVFVRSKPGAEKAFTMASFFGMTFLLYSWFVYPLTVGIAILTFLSIGLFVARARHLNFVEDATIPIEADSPKGFVVALFIIFFMVFGVVGLYIAGQKYVAAILYGRGVELLQNTGEVNSAERLFTRAASFDGNRDQYYRAIAETSFMKLQRTVADAGNAAPEDVRNNFQLALSNAITSAQAAADASPSNSSNWRTLGQIYEAVMPFVNGAADAAIDAYKKAIERAPHDPVLYDDVARVYVAQGDYVKAREVLDKAVNLKSDYATAHFRLAQIAALKGNVPEAIKNTENAAKSAPNDIGVMFQLGLLYYQQDRLQDAQAALERAVTFNKNYSNARYFLGLTYGRREDFPKAIEQFEKILELNPGNAEVVKILSNLRARKSPLDGISPPGPAPQQRGTPPVKQEEEQASSEEEDQRDDTESEDGSTEN